MVILLMALIVFVAIFIVGYPFVNPERFEYADATGNDNLEQLASTRNTVFEAIRDLESDRATGKLSDQDYSQLRARYDVQAAQVLQQIDALTAAPQASSAKKTPKPKTAAGDTCPHCHKRILTDDRFCSSCGARLN